MAIPLKQSTASQEVVLGYFLDSTDGNTEETGLTIANTDIKIHKAGAITLASKNSGGATHISNGLYYAVLDATDTDTLGPLVIFCHVTGALAVKVECCVHPAEWYDTMISGTDSLTADLTATAQTAVETKAGAAITTAALATAASLTTLSTKVGTPAGASVSADVAALKAETAAILVDTGTTLDAAVAAVKVDTAAILVDTGTTLDANLTAVKAKTDSLVFTVAGVVDANVQRINDVTITGDGNATKFGV